MRTKGQAEDAVAALYLPSVHFYQPGLITDRDNDFRFGEWLGGWVPFLPKISGKQLGSAILWHALITLENP